ncbi:hypothetical protein N9355_09455 [Crocinitomicaceae bacterium]|nr:hypothetical protein [Crocinitomicaceae bacterium]
MDKEDRQELAQYSSKKERSEKVTHNQMILEQSKEESKGEEVATTIEEVQENESISSKDAPEITSTEVNELTTEEIEEDPSKSQKVRQALIAENNARKAKISFVWSLSMFATFILPFLGIVALFSIVPFIIGSIRLRQSNRSDYITLEGERDARSARIMQLIYGVLLALGLIAISIILIILLL